MFVTIHALQSLPYSNLNRDREGAPKTCEYGGVVRARVSSQAWKRPIRDAIETELGASTWRTRRLAPKIADRLIAAGWNGDDARRAGRAVLDAAAGAAAKSASKQGGLRPDPDTDESNIMLWVADAALDELVALCDSQHDAIVATPLPTPKKSGRKATKPSDSEHEQPERVTVLDGAAVLPALETRNPVISLLGRFVAELPGSQVDGAVQMAHAISVNATTDEVDFFATVDDYLDDGSRGAAHIGDAEYTSGTMYRYATVNVDRLAANLGTEDAPDLDGALQLVDVFARAFCRELPTGKQNVTAAHTWPDFVYTTVTDRPLSLVTAFEKALRPSSNGYLERAVAQLDRYNKGMVAFTGEHPHWHGHAISPAAGADEPANLGELHTGISDLVRATTDAASDTAAARDTAGAA
ncbi:type I-E CRISPR-associated protein Cas7/Cse4/CasC [Prauserella alba]|uniref:Type I-E CRISPR-associated protein Cas7/Cse4/CasC n=1 Tax=Prauserella alba TaxID=176898 RepID=A0ABN1VLW4_9PSEU|nr:type I-E CRISPR-associated protein Cas7/Cse4/CasC [Prauserella alba]MCP2182192.1 CRISPR-associated protein, Cse4 family [Prauserella alba]